VTEFYTPYGRVQLRGERWRRAAALAPRRATRWSSKASTGSHWSSPTWAQPSEL